MIVAIVGNDMQYNNLKNLCTYADAHSFIHVTALTNLDKKVDVLFDFSFDSMVSYSQIADIVFVNEVIENNIDLNRFNGWNTFYDKAPLEVVVKSENEVNTLTALGINYTSVVDICGMITARVVSMIINEAYFALGENVSTKEEIDTAMKLGTNYPYGPFEWAEKIGLCKIYNLLMALSLDERYTPAPVLVNEINKA